jgi:hypothetical protein
MRIRIFRKTAAKVQNTVCASKFFMLKNLSFTLAKASAQCHQVKKIAGGRVAGRGDPMWSPNRRQGRTRRFAPTNPGMVRIMNYKFR